MNKKVYYQQFQDNFLLEHWDIHPLLTEEHCETLALGKFLWEQIDKIDGKDYSGPGLHFSGVFEAFISQTVFTHYDGLSQYNTNQIPDPWSSTFLTKCLLSKYIPFST